MGEGKSIWIVHHQDGGDQWQVRREGEDEPLSIHRMKEDAHMAGREAAKRDEVELIIQGADGQILEKDSFGNDPRDIPG